jgi:hypothetical protein
VLERVVQALQHHQQGRKGRFHACREWRLEMHVLSVL